ncbi:hypothetical protein [Streptomyces sp. DH10]|uniref:hypothetical protein n=1 Tax=Streptomyces sp. DH10 TaxID=3040121 RepID=UPI0024415EA0|nr:hypothetical protein [Streptomyces sp. DH10]MDG9710626.1 hypothetical protein [Streptomyces sp. DH10]
MTTARLQYAGALEQQNRIAQRTAYVGFFAATHAFRQALRREVPGRANPDPFREVHRALRDAYIAVELEGPPSVLAAADAVVGAGFGVTQFVYNDADLMETWRTLHIAAQSQQPAAVALQALRDVQRVVAETSPDQRKTLTETNNRSGRDHNDDPQSPAARWRAARQQARQTAHATGGLLTDDQAEILLLDVSTFPSNALESVMHVSLDFEQAADALVQTARNYLNDTAPEI